MPPSTYCIVLYYIILYMITGFFCPEMITHGSYYGDKSDVWSIGGIMLELILGASLRNGNLLIIKSYVLFLLKQK